MKLGYASKVMVGKTTSQRRVVQLRQKYCEFLEYAESIGAEAQEIKFATKDLENSWSVLEVIAAVYITGSIIGTFFGIVAATCDDDDPPKLHDMDKWVQEHGFSWPSNHRWWEDETVNMRVNQQLGDTIRRNIGKDIVLGNITDSGLEKLLDIPVVHVAVPDEQHRDQLTKRKPYEPDLRDWDWIQSRKKELSDRYPTFQSFNEVDLTDGPKFIIATPGTGKSHLIKSVGVLGGKRGSASRDEKLRKVRVGYPFFVDGSDPMSFSSVIPDNHSVHSLEGEFEGKKFDSTKNPDFVKEIIDKSGKKWALFRNGPDTLGAFERSVKDGEEKDWDTESKRRIMNGPADNNVSTGSESNESTKGAEITWEQNQSWLKGKSMDELKEAIKNGDAVVLRNKDVAGSGVESERDAFKRVSVDHPSKYLVPETMVGLEGNEPSSSDMNKGSETKDEQPSKSLLKKTSFRK
jgi:hypothetical protein